MALQKILLAFLIGFLVTLPLHDPGRESDYCLLLAKGFAGIGAERIVDHHYIFVPGVDGHELQGKISNLPASSRTAVKIAEYEDLSLLVVEEANPEGFGSGAIKELKAMLDQSGFSTIEVWNSEALLPGGAASEDLFRRAFDLAGSLGGEVQNAAAYNGSVHLLAYLPQIGTKIVVEDDPVNLNLELFTDPVAGGIRVRAGIPLLLSPSLYF